MYHIEDSWQDSAFERYATDIRHMNKILMNQPQPPCVEHDCPLLTVCANSNLACDAYRFYVRDGVNGSAVAKSQKPTIKFTENRKGNQSIKFHITDIGRIIATKKIEKKIFKGSCKELGIDPLA